MSDINEINERAKEIEKDLCKLREAWVEMYEKITKLIEDTTTEKE